MLHRMKFLIYMIVPVLLIGCGGCKKADTFVNCRRTGGFLGLDDYMTIDQEGNAILKRRDTQTEFKLDGDTMNRLETSLTDAKFTKLKKDYLPSRQGGDLIEYTITYSGHTVRMMDTTVPETIQPILNLLNQIVENRDKP